MKRLILLALLGCLAALAASQVATAGTTPSPGCKGVMNALDKSDRGTKGQAALTDVATKLGCGTVEPPPVDDMACSTGSVELSYWLFDPTATPSGPPGQFVPLSSSTSPYPAYGDKRGFYIEPDDAPLTEIVIKSVLVDGVAEVHRYTATKDANGHWYGTNANDFENNADIQYVRFCGTAS